MFATEPSALTPWILGSHRMGSGGELESPGFQTPSVYKWSCKTCFTGKCCRVYKRICDLWEGTQNVYEGRHCIPCSLCIQTPLQVSLLTVPGWACPGQQSWCRGSTPAVVCSPTLPGLPCFVPTSRPGAHCRARAAVRRGRGLGLLRFALGHPPRFARGLWCLRSEPSIGREGSGLQASSGSCPTLMYYRGRPMHGTLGCYLYLTYSAQMSQNSGLPGLDTHLATVYCEVIGVGCLPFLLGKSTDVPSGAWGLLWGAEQGGRIPEGRLMCPWTQLCLL